VVGGDALNLFHPQELELLLCGAPDLDFHALEEVTHYEVRKEGGRARAKADSYVRRAVEKKAWRKEGTKGGEREGGREGGRSTHGLCFSHSVHLAGAIKC